MGGIEQRKHRRYNLPFPVLVRSKDRGEPPIETSSKDISASGIFLVLSEEFALGTELEMEVTLPAELTGGKSVQLRCRGKIIRMEHMNSEGKIGVGASITRYEFIRKDKAEAS